MGDGTHTVPIGVQSPVVVSEGTHFLHLEWLPPAQPNGVITLYNLYVGGVLSFSGLNTSGHSGIQWSQPSGYSHGPLPRHPLFFSLVAYNAGGSTQSNASSVTTIESSPDGVPFPNVTIINATALAIVWSTSLVPNGIVTGYVVLQTNIPSSGFSYVSTDLQPFTTYSCSILACTVRGCGPSTPTLAITAEPPPPPPPPPSGLHVHVHSCAQRPSVVSYT